MLISETIEDDYFADFPICPRIKTLEFVWYQLDETHDLVSKLTDIVPFFPNLIKLKCNFLAENHLSKEVDYYFNYGLSYSRI